MDSPDFVVLGLGNPGDRYQGTRHNLGFDLVEAMARDQGQTLAPGPGASLICPFTVGTDRGILAEPMTWMNRSGLAAEEIHRVFGGPQLARWLVVIDDLDLPLGRIRFRKGGGPGGHNGLKSVIEELGEREIPRLRMGIGRPDSDERDTVVSWVLEPFSPAERPVVEEAIERAAEGVRVFVSEGIEEAMSRFNAG